MDKVIEALFAIVAAVAVFMLVVAGIAFIAAVVLAVVLTLVVGMWASAVFAGMKIAQSLEWLFHLHPDLDPVAGWALFGASLAVALASPRVFRFFNFMPLLVAAAVLPLLLLVGLRVLAGMDPEHVAALGAPGRAYLDFYEHGSRIRLRRAEALLEGDRLVDAARSLNGFPHHRPLISRDAKARFQELCLETYRRQIAEADRLGDGAIAGVVEPVAGCAVSETLAAPNDEPDVKRVAREPAVGGSPLAKKRAVEATARPESESPLAPAPKGIPRFEAPNVVLERR